MKANPKVYLALDLGASSGRAVLGSLDRGRLRLQEIHRFANGPVERDGSLCWDFPGLWRNVVASLRRCRQRGHQRLAGIGVDTWGVDFGLLGKDGQLLANPLCYRDELAAGAVPIIRRAIGADALYRLTGLAPGRVSSLAQLVGLKQAAGDRRLRQAATFLMMPDLFRYFLCGHRAVEYTPAGVSALVNIRTGQWCAEVFRALGLPRRILPPLVRAGTVAGPLYAALAAATGLERAPVVIVAGHDTLSAAAAAPITEPGTAFISCGTWSVVGDLRAEPITTPAARRAGFVNERAVDGILFARNLTGLYLFENLRRALRAHDGRLSYAQLIRAAAAARPFGGYLDVDAPECFVTENPVAAIATFLKRTGQAPVAGWPAAARVILEGIAWSYRHSLRALTALTGESYHRICLVGGGCRNRLLCQWVADATGLPVQAGPAEATVAGNLGLQALATGQLADACGLRALVRASFPPRGYRPQETGRWDRAAARVPGRLVAGR